MTRIRPAAPGKFITFEGGEGAGKSTQIILLAQALKRRKIKTLQTREPGGSPGAEIIRHVLLSGAAKPLGPATEAILFAAARDDHLREVIRPALKRGEWVLCDRFSDSTRIYQGSLGQVDTALINALERITVGNARPDLTLVLDIDPEIGMARAAARRGTGLTDRFEAEDMAFHMRLRDAYRSLTEQEPQRCVLIDASGDEKQVAQNIWEAVSSRLGLRAKPRKGKAKS